MKAIDDNDRLRAGTLPHDAFADAIPVYPGENGHSHRDEAPATRVVPPLPQLHTGALHGLAGEWVNEILPDTEAHAAGLLVSLLVAAGSAMGPSPHVRIKRTAHRLNLYACLSGSTSEGRKGEAIGEGMRTVRAAADPAWATRERGGLSSAEGLVAELQDAVQKDDDGEIVATKPVDDPRLMVREGELAGPLHAMQREGNRLSPILRDAWDNAGPLRTMTKASPQCATNHYVSILAAITDDEIRDISARGTSMVNGLYNRILWVHVERSKLLRSLQRRESPAMDGIVERLGKRIARARSVGEMRLTPAAESLWGGAGEGLIAAPTSLYAQLNRAGRGCERAPPYAVRLAAIYALLDGRDEIDLQHLATAAEVVIYCRDSWIHIFGSGPVAGSALADDILALLEDTEGRGLTRTEITRGLGNHKSGRQLDDALAQLDVAKRAHCKRGDPPAKGGRPAERWFAA